MNNKMDHHLWIMILLSVMAGLLSTMNNWVSNINDITVHLNDLYMASLMTGWMILLMTIVLFNRLNNPYFFIILSISIIAMSIIFIRTQTFIDEQQYLKSMIPHHSMAILMSERIKNKTRDNKIIEFANKIIESQENEISEMKKLLNNY